MKKKYLTPEMGIFMNNGIDILTSSTVYSTQPNEEEVGFDDFFD